MKTAFLAASLALSMTALPSAMAADEQDAHGDQVDFDLMKIGGGYQIKKISPSSN